MSQRELTPEHYSAADVVALFRLEPLPGEGGFFRRMAEGEVVSSEDQRAYSVIYFLLTPDGFSAMHRLKKDEIWCFHSGDPVESLRLAAGGSGEWVRLGSNPERGELPQTIIRAHTWQGTRLVAGGRWALITCVVAPEFRREDFELGDRGRLAASHPAFSEGIVALTRDNLSRGSAYLG
ncbi:MAG TPA: cupin domain-containing protein [Lacunisphaera sp.]|jgi:hypothetical protein